MLRLAAYTQTVRRESLFREDKMYKIHLIILLLLIFPSSLLYGEIVEVPLPEFNGFYSDSICTRTAHFTMLKIPIEVYNVSIRLCGIAETGLLECEGPYGLPVQGPWWTQYDIFMLDQTTGKSWYASFTYEDSSSVLDTTRTFSPDSGATWEFLKSGQGELTLRWYPLGTILLCWDIREPNVSIYDAVLVVDGEFPVPTENASWGVIKSRYSQTE
jgi:hypothetical protein